MNQKLIRRVRDAIASHPSHFQQDSWGPCFNPPQFSFDGSEWELAPDDVPCSIGGHALRIIPLTRAEKERMVSVLERRRRPVDDQSPLGDVWSILVDAAQRRLRLPENIRNQVLHSSWPPSFFRPGTARENLTPTAADAVWLLDRISKGRYDAWNRTYDEYRFPYPPAMEDVERADTE